MVDRESSALASSISIEEKESKNKRKFCDDPPQPINTDPTSILPPFESMDENPETPNAEYLMGMCGVCENCEEADWNDIGETQLEEIVLNYLGLIFRSAIRKIVACGYIEEVATGSLLSVNKGWHGSKDTVSNIVDNALGFLRREKEVGLCLKEDSPKELKKLEKCTLNQMVCFVRCCRPCFSRGDAMWRLLMSDMNVSVVCSGDYDPEFSVGSFQFPPFEQESNCSSSSSSKASAVRRFSAKESVISSISCMVEESSSIYTCPLSENRPAGGKKGHSSGSSSKRESILRQKSVHFEKSYRMLGAKAGIRGGKNSSFGGLLLDKKSLMKMNNRATETDKPPQADLTLTVPSKSTDHIPSPSPVVNNELSSLLPTTDWVPQDKMDELIRKLAHRVKELDTQLQEWSDWANQKVMQAACRLGRDKEDLQNLRQGKDEVTSLKKEKHSLVESTRKRLSEMEIALSKANAQVKKFNAEARDLEIKKSELIEEMKAAKLQADESALNCQEASRREKETVKSFQSWEREKTMIQEELAMEKKKFLQIQQQVKQAKEQLDQIKANWKQEEKAKDKVLAHLNSVRKEREQIEVSGRSTENLLHLEAETELQRYREQIKKLQHQIAQVRQRNDSSRTAALSWGSDSRCSSRFVDLQEEAEEEDIPRERECVMCLSQESSVVFVPCTHQVVCSNCNEEHEEKGGKDCPVCLTHIDMRIRVRSRYS